MGKIESYKCQKCHRQIKVDLTLPSNQTECPTCQFLNKYGKDKKKRRRV